MRGRICGLEPPSTGQAVWCILMISFAPTSCLQTPLLGHWSDLHGRKPFILVAQVGAGCRGGWEKAPTAETGRTTRQCGRSFEHMRPGGEQPFGPWFAGCASAQQASGYFLLMLAAWTGSLGGRHAQISLLDTHVARLPLT